MEEKTNESLEAYKSENFRMGMKAFKAGNKKEAYNYLKEAASELPHDAEVRNAFALCCVQRSELQTAVIHYQHAIAIRPDFRIAMNDLAVVYTRLQRYDDAIDMFKMLLDKYPSHAVGYYNLAKTYEKDKRYAEAIDAYHAALVIDPTLAVANNNLGWLLLAELNYSDALHCFEMAYFSKAGNTKALYGICLASARLEKWDEALRNMILYNSIVKNDSEAMSLLGTITMAIALREKDAVGVDRAEELLIKGFLKMRASVFNRTALISFYDITKRRRPWWIRFLC